MPEIDLEALAAQRARASARAAAAIEAKRAKSTQGYNQARQRAGKVAQAMLDGGACPHRALEAADRVFVDTIKLVSGAQPAKAATAASVTKALRADDAGAVRYALDASVTGALYQPRMRVKARSGAVERPSAPQPPKADACAYRLDQARSGACRDLTQAIQTFRTARNGAAKDAARSKIRAIFKHWEGDSIVIETAIAAGWRP